jgi:hypothetical protein
VQDGSYQVMEPLVLQITIPPNAEGELMDFQDAIVKHLENGLKLNQLGEGKWDSEIGITMEVVNVNG